MIAANDRPGPDTIVLKWKTYTLAIPPSGPNDDTTGDLNVTDTLTVKREKLPRSATVRARRRRATVDVAGVDLYGWNAFAVPAQLTLSGLLLRNFTYGVLGGTDKQLTVVDSKLATGAANSYGILAYGPASLARDLIGPVDNDGAVLFSRTSVSHTKVSRVGRSGIVEVGNPAGGDRLTVTASSVRTSGETGIIAVNRDGLAVSRTKVIGNGDGGLVAPTQGRVTVRNSVVSGNRGSGGIVLTGQGPIDIARATISANSTTLGSGAGVVYAALAPLTLTSSTVSGNQAHGDAGGLLLIGPSATLTNDTVFGNSATGTGGGILFANAGTANFNAVTIVRNHANSDDTGPDVAGGIYNGAGTATVHNVVVALNTIGGSGLGPNCYGAFTSAGHNLLGTIDSPGCTGFNGTGDLVNPAPKLGGLRDNGGPTRTACPRRGSPVINKGGSDAPRRDQRGHKRIGRPDIGACEFVGLRRHHRR